MRGRVPRSYQADSCLVEGCLSKPHAKGMCSSHLGRWKRHGDPLLGGTAMGSTANFLKSLPSEGEGCLLWPFARDHNGYGKVFVNGRLRYASRAICEIVNGPPRGKQEAAHTCGKGHEGCVAPWHLVWKSRQENLDDKWAHGTGGVKLTEADVRQIRALRPDLSYAKIAERFGITASSAHEAATGRTWRHVR